MTTPALDGVEDVGDGFCVCADGGTRTDPDPDPDATPPEALAGDGNGVLDVDGVDTVCADTFGPPPASLLAF